MKQQLTLRRTLLFVLPLLLCVMLAAALGLGTATRVDAAPTEQSGEHVHSTPPEELEVVYPATCVVPGIGIYTCEECQEVVPVILPADGYSHVTSKDSGGKCIYCGKTPTAAYAPVTVDGTQTTEAEADHYEVKAEEAGDETRLVIPAEYKGKEVHVADEAFKETNDMITELVVAAPQIGANAFTGLTNLTEVTVEETAKTIGAGAFENLANLEEVTLGEGLESIGENAFAGTKYIENAENWDGNALYNGTYLLKVSEDAPVAPKARRARASEEALTEFTVAEGTTVIADGAFKGLKDLTKVTLPATGLKTIGENAFDGTGLKSIFLPKDIANVAGLNFSLKIYYDGPAPAEGVWEYEGKLGSATVYFFSDSEPTVAGNFWHRDAETQEIVEWAKLTELELADYQEVLYRGNEFTTGESFKVNAIYDDGTKRESVLGYTVDSSAVKMDTVGTYEVKVTYLYVEASYTVTVREGNHKVTFVFGNGTPNDVHEEIPDGSTVTLPEAPTRAGYTFAGWQIGEDGEIRQEGSVTVTSDLTVTAQWTPKQPAISFSWADGETHDGVTANAVFDAEAETYTVTVEGAPTKLGYKHTGYKATLNGGTDGLTAQEDGSFTFKIADDMALVLTPTWEQLYTVNAAVASHAKVTFEDPQAYYASGDSITFTVAVDKGYKLVSVKNGETDLIAGENGTYTVTVGNANILITVETAEVTVTVTFVEADGVTFGNVKAEITYADDRTTATVKLTGDPVNEKPHTRFDGWTVSGYTYDPESGLTLDLTNADLELIFSAKYTQLYTVQTNIAEGNIVTVSFDPALQKEYENGATVTFTVELVDGYKLVSVKSNGSELTAGDKGVYTVTINNENITITVETRPFGDPQLRSFDKAELRKDGDDKVYLVLTLTIDEITLENLQKTTWLDNKFQNNSNLQRSVDVEKVERLSAGNQFELYFNITASIPDGEWVRARQITINGKEYSALPTTVEFGETTNTSTADGTTYTLAKEGDSFVYYLVTKQYTVTFNYAYPNEEAKSESLKVTHSKDHTLSGDLLNPAKEGYTFLGWFRDNAEPEEKIEGNKITNVQEDRSYTAKWQINQNKIDLTRGDEYGDTAGSLTWEPVGETIESFKGLTLTLTVNEGYTATVVVNGVPVESLKEVEQGTHTYTIERVVSDVKIELTFTKVGAAKVRLTVEAVAAGTAVKEEELGTALTDINGQGDVEVGTSKTVTFVVKDGYGVVEISGTDAEPTTEVVAGGIEYTLNVSVGEEAVTIQVKIGKRIKVNGPAKGVWSLNKNNFQFVEYDWEWYTDGQVTTLYIYDVGSMSEELIQSTDFTNVKPYATYQLKAYGDLSWEKIEGAINAALGDPRPESLTLAFALKKMPSAAEAEEGYIDTGLCFAVKVGTTTRDTRTFEIKPVKPDPKLTSVYNLTIVDTTMDFYAKTEYMDATTMNESNTFLKVGDSVSIKLKSAENFDGNTKVHFYFDLTNIDKVGSGALSLEIAGKSYPLTVDGTDGDPWNKEVTVGNYKLTFTGDKGSPASLTIEDIKYSIKFSQDEDATGYPTVEPVAKGNLVNLDELATPTKNGFKFSYWYYLSEGEEEETKVSGSIDPSDHAANDNDGDPYTLTLYAKFEADVQEQVSGSYTITIDNVKSYGTSYAKYEWEILDQDKKTVLIEGSLYGSASTPVGGVTQFIQFSRETKNGKKRWAYFVNSKATPAPITGISITYQISGTSTNKIPEWSLMTSDSAYTVNDSSNPTVSGNSSYGKKAITVFNNTAGTIKWDNFSGSDKFFALYLDDDMMTGKSAAQVTSITIEYGGTTGGGETTDADLQKAQQALDSLVLVEAESGISEEALVELMTDSEGVTFNWTLDNEEELGAVVEFEDGGLFVYPDAQEHDIKLSVTATYNGQTTAARQFTIHVSAVSGGEGGGDEQTKTWQKLTNVSDLEDGMQILLTATLSGTKYYSGSYTDNRNSSTKKGYFAAIKDANWKEGSQALPANAMALTLRKPADASAKDYWIIEYKSGDTVQYLSMSGSSNQNLELLSTADFELRSSTDKDKAYWKIEADSIVNKSFSTNGLRFNIDQKDRFSNYKTSYGTTATMEIYILKSTASDVGTEGPSMVAYTASMNGGEQATEQGAWLYAVLGGTAMLALSAVAVVLLLRSRKHD